MEENKKAAPELPEENAGTPEENRDAPSEMEAAESSVPSTTNYQPSTSEDMEVHHHAHDPAATHHKKNWKAYFWEFLMLFLAVFCGFLAEYQLEHVIERDREKQYVQSLLNDLKTDLTNIQYVINQNIFVKETGDSLYTLLTMPDYSNHTNSIYYLGRKYSSRIYFNMTDGTLRQLTNSGGLRLIKQKDVVDSIQAYQYVYSEVVKAQETKELQLLSYRDVMCRVFDVRILETMVIGETITRPAGNPSLFSQNKELINELLMKAHFVKRNNAQLINMLTEMKRKALNLQKTINKEYHLE